MVRQNKQFADTTLGSAIYIFHIFGFFSRFIDKMINEKYHL